MRKSTVLRFALLAALGAALLIAACVNPVADVLGAKSWGLVGTWSNQNYNSLYPTATYGATMVLGSDGTFKTTSSMGTFVGTYTVESVSVDGAARTYKLQVNAGSPTPSLWRVLARVTNSTTWEAVCGTYPNDPYPTSVTSSGMNYGKLTLQ